MDTQHAQVPSVATYSVPAMNRSELVRKLEQLERRADKLGTVKPTWRILPGIVVENFLRPGAKHAEDTVRVRCIQVEVSAAPICLAGWHFCGILERRGDQNRLLAIEPLPEWCRTVRSKCDHCQADRRRSETYIVRNDAGEYKQVGSSCLADFVGADSAETAALSCALLRGVHELLDPDRDEFGIGGIHPLDLDHDLVELLCFVLECVKRMGYVSAKAALHPSGTTGCTALEMMLFPKQRPDSWGVNRDDIFKANRERAQAVVDYWAQAAASSDYEHNCRLVASQGYATRRDANLVASMVAIYDRRAAEKARLTTCKNEHVGSLKERLVLDVAVEAITYLELYDTHMYVMRDAEGRDLRWFASSSAGFEAGKTYKIAGTVKKHEVRNDRMVTVLTRCALAKEKAPKARAPKVAAAAA